MSLPTRTKHRKQDGRVDVSPSAAHSHTVQRCLGWLSITPSFDIRKEAPLNGRISDHQLAQSPFLAWRASSEQAGCASSREGNKKLPGKLYHLVCLLPSSSNRSVISMWEAQIRRKIQIGCFIDKKEYLHAPCFCFWRIHGRGCTWNCIRSHSEKGPRLHGDEG